MRGPSRFVVRRPFPFVRPQATRPGRRFQRPRRRHPHEGSLSEALRNVESLTALPHVRLLAEGDGFLEVYREVAGGLPVRGNLVPDAHLASLLGQHGVRTLYTRDADFRKFAFLEVRDPFAPPKRPAG